MDELTSLAILIFGGLLLRFSLSLTGQAWAKSHAQTVAFMILPVITYVITKTITGNIALSLGMIGALSIVRFRNPVKNPFELVIFFALITIGIGISVNVKLGILMTAITIVVILGAKTFENIFKKSGKNLFALSFEEGSSVHILEVKSTTSIKILEESKNLSQFFSSKDPISYNYRLIFSDKDEVNNLKKSIQDNKDIDSIEVRYAP